MAKKNKNKKINPNRVTHTLKQLYMNQANAIRRKITRRQVWAEEWSKKSEEIEQNMKTMEMIESQAVSDLELQLATTQAIETETSSTICSIQTEIEENHLKYKQVIARLEMEKTEGIRETTAEVSLLDQKEKEIRYFMAHQNELYEGLTQRQEKIITEQQKHRIELLKLQQSRVAQSSEQLTKEIEQKIQIFATGLRKLKKMDDPVYEEKAHLLERGVYVCDQIQDLEKKIPETRNRIQELSRERKECFKNLSLKGFDKGKKLSKKLEDKCELKIMKSSLGSQTEECDEGGFEPSEEISELRIKAVLKGIIKLTAEARALVLIPRAGLPKEAKLNDEEVHLRYMNRRDFIIKRRQCILELIQEVLQHGKPDFCPLELPTTPKQATPSPEPSYEEAEEETSQESSSSSLPRSPTPTPDEDSNDVLSLHSLSWDYPIEE